MNRQNPSQLKVYKENLIAEMELKSEQLNKDLLKLDIPPLVITININATTTMQPPQQQHNGILLPYANNMHKKNRILVLHCVDIFFCVVFLFLFVMLPVPCCWCCPSFCTKMLHKYFSVQWNLNTYLYMQHIFVCCISLQQYYICTCMLLRK